MQAPPLVGVIVGGGLPRPGQLPRLAVLLLANCLLVAHIYCFNDWADAALDRQDPNKARRALLNRGITSSRILTTALVLAAACLGMLACLGLRFLGTGVLLILLSTLYSFPDPRIEGKRRVVFPSLLHLTGSIFYFLLGYLLDRGLDARGLLIGGFFGLAIVAGHLTQEVKDHHGDQHNGIATAAVRYGPRTMFAVSLGIFALAFFYVFWLARTGRLPGILQGLILLLPVHLGLAGHAYRRGLTFAVVERYRHGYQLLFGLIALLIGLACVLY